MKIELILHEISLKKDNQLEKKFFTAKEFSLITGMPYSTVLYKCNTGLIRARQDSPGSSWLIFGDEIQRFTNEANDNGSYE